MSKKASISHLTLKNKLNMLLSRYMARGSWCLKVDDAKPSLKAWSINIVVILEKREGSK